MNILRGDFLNSDNSNLTNFEQEDFLGKHDFQRCAEDGGGQQYSHAGQNLGMKIGGQNRQNLWNSLVNMEIAGIYIWMFNDVHKQEMIFGLMFASD